MWLVLAGLAVDPAAPQVRDSGAGGWQTAPSPVLVPGQPGQWDDFRVGQPVILRVGEHWWMYYAGEQLDERGITTGIGLATTRDGLAWEKYSQNPLLTVDDPPEEVPAPSRIGWPAACQLQDRSFLMIYVQEARRSGAVSLRVARSEDGMLWRRSIPDEKSLAETDVDVPVLSPCSTAIPIPRTPCTFGTCSTRGRQRELLWCTGFLGMGSPGRRRLLGPPRRSTSKGPFGTAPLARLPHVGIR